MNAQRLFIAIDLPDQISESLAGLDPHYRGPIFSPPQQIHLTLGFFVAVEPPNADLLKQKLQPYPSGHFFFPSLSLGHFQKKGCLTSFGLESATPIRTFFNCTSV